MFRFVVLTWGLVAGWGWWLFAAKSTTLAVVIGILLGAITLTLALIMYRRSRRLRGEHEYVNARLEYHSNASKSHWKRAKPSRGDDGGAEMSLGGGL
jgi:hypothetical protein